MIPAFSKLIFSSNYIPLYIRLKFVYLKESGSTLSSESHTSTLLKTSIVMYIWIVIYDVKLKLSGLKAQYAWAFNAILHLSFNFPRLIRDKMDDNFLWLNNFLSYQKLI